MLVTFWDFSHISITKACLKDLNSPIYPTDSFTMLMKKQYLPLRYIYILCCCLPFIGQAQSTYDIKQDIASIYSELKKAVGTSRANTKWPSLEISTKQYCVAAYSRSGGANGTIVFEKDAYLVCKDMGKNKNAAIAFLLGHELTHFFQDKKWDTQGFLMPNASAISVSAMHEYEADVHGAFIAYLAGYAVHEVVGPLLDNIYRVYELNDTKLGAAYPKLAARKSASVRASQKSKNLETTYEASNYFMALGWHTEAIHCYEHLLEQIQAKELYNNLGTAFLASAIGQVRKNDKSTFYYPIELDSDFSIFSMQHRSQKVYLNNTELLSNAIRNFEAATKIDNEYFSAQLNKACAYDLLRKYEKTNTKNPWIYVNKADRIAAKSPSRLRSIQLSKIAIAKGILSASEYRDSSAYYFDIAVRHGWNIAVRKLAKKNKKIAQAKKPSPTPIPPLGEYTIEDMIDGINLRHGLNTKFDAKIEGAAIYGSNTKPSIGLKYMEHSEIIGISSLTGNSFLQFTKDKTVKTDRGIAVGSSVTGIKKAYGNEPYKIINQNKGYFMVYPGFRLIFDLDENQYVRGWGIYIER